MASFGCCDPEHRGATCLMTSVHHHLLQPLRSLATGWRLAIDVFHLPQQMAQGRHHALGAVALGKNSCWPLILWSAIAFCPSGEISQSMKAWPNCFFTCGCFA